MVLGAEADIVGAEAAIQVAQANILSAEAAVQSAKAGIPTLAVKDVEQTAISGDMASVGP